ncbi:MAG: hypothetical protein N3D82_05420 [Ignisphaera sp.]|nr:hypothetical protein [Ignisphaera sp.]MCX8168445.1 hypothetical protein [Ignisphaera sp.]MDW8085115.1 hypothetical protein [Ignisphaera sp.]
MPYEITEFHDIPNALAKRILKEYIERVSSYDIIPELIRSTMDYLDRTSKCDDKAVEYIYEMLKNLKLKDTTISMILNILPRNLDELRILLTFEETIPDDSILNKILDAINQNCQQE